MTLDELRALLLTPGEGNVIDIPATINALKGGRAVLDLVDPLKQYDVNLHNSMDKALRPDKPVRDEEGTIKRIEKENRVGLALQELITERAVSFLFGSPVKIVCETANALQVTILGALNRILKDNKIDGFNAEIALEMFKSTEVAEYWFAVEGSEVHTNYGFPTKFKLRTTAFNPSEGSDLYPLFDQTGDLIAFSRQFRVIGDKNEEVNYFETYTDLETIIWQQTGSAWIEFDRVVNPIGKIPVIYGKQKSVEWASVQNLIDRLEHLLSNYANTTDYHGSPTIFVQGKIEGWAQKGESGKIIQGGKDSKAEYLSWTQAPEMVKLEIETLFRFIYSISQTPDISFEAVKGLGEISGVALKMLFLDAHLKVKRKQRVFDPYLERRTNIILAYLAFFNTALKADTAAIHIEAQIQPFIVDDEKSMIDRLTEANGGKPIISQKTSIKLSGLVEDVDAEYQQVQEEQAREQAFGITQ